MGAHDAYMRHWLAMGKLFPTHKKLLKQAETMYYSITPSIKTSY